MNRKRWAMLLGLLISIGGGFLAADCSKGIDFCLKQVVASGLAYLAGLVPGMLEDLGSPPDPPSMDWMKFLAFSGIQIVVFVVVGPAIVGQSCVSDMSAISFIIGSSISRFGRGQLRPTPKEDRQVAYA
jgi:hypothetical protein